ncbi:hypothetical protein Sjap_026313 [Stephania japonica]|uniref:Uncharacterized protein n=1 Tax=Stephania japonica TaxID=461633 RepID=A0AAP0HIE0_9MAGN
MREKAMEELGRPRRSRTASSRNRGDQENRLGWLKGANYEKTMGRLRLMESPRSSAGNGAGSLMVGKTMKNQYPQEKEQGSLSVLTGVLRYVKNVCAKTFEDILQPVCLNNSCLPTIRANGGNKCFRGTMATSTPIIMPQLASFIDKQRFDEASSSTSVPSRDQVMLNHMAQPWGPSKDDVPQDERTMFMTFSRGYPLSEKEVQEYFAR